MQADTLKNPLGPDRQPARNEVAVTRLYELELPVNFDLTATLRDLAAPFGVNHPDSLST
jgi:hypothetical protein